MPALFLRSNSKRQRISAPKQEAQDEDLLKRANDGFWTPGMGEPGFSTESVAPTTTDNFLASSPSPTVSADPTTLTIESPTVVTLSPSVIYVTVTSVVEVTGSALPSGPFASGSFISGPVASGSGALNSSSTSTGSFYRPPRTLVHTAISSTPTSLESSQASSSGGLSTSTILPLSTSTISGSPASSAPTQAASATDSGVFGGASSVVKVVSTESSEVPTATESASEALSTSESSSTIDSSAEASSTDLVSATDSTSETQTATETASAASATPTDSTSAVESATLSSESADASSTVTASESQSSGIFVLPSNSRINLVSTSVEGLESPSITNTLTERSTSAADLSTSSALETSSEVIFTIPSSSRIAIVSTTDATSSPVIVSISSSSAPSSSSTSAPVASSSTPTDRVFTIPSSRIAAVSTSAAASSSSASRSRASASASSSSSASRSSASYASRSSASAASSRAAASSSSSFNDSPTPRPGTLTDENGNVDPTRSSNASGSKSTSTSMNDDGSATGQASSAAEFFGSIGRSPISITLTALVSAGILAILIGILAFFIRRCHRRRKRNAFGHQLGSEGGTPGAPRWVNDKEYSEKEGAPIRNLMDEDDLDDSDVHPEAVWRRRMSSMDSSLGGHRGPRVAMAPDMSPISERVASSDWTSFGGDHEWGSDGEESRRGSNDAALASIGVARRQSLPSFALPTSSNGNQTFGSATTSNQLLRPNPHPLRHSFVPTTPSQYSNDSASDHTMQMHESPSLSPPGPYPSPRALPTIASVMLSAGSPPVGADEVRSPSQPGSWRQSLDKVMTAAAEYLSGKLPEDRLEEGNDRYTAFRSSTFPSRGGPISIPAITVAPSHPGRAATYSGAGPQSSTRHLSTFDERSIQKRPLSDASIESRPASSFLTIQGQVARGARGTRTRLAQAAGREHDLDSQRLLGTGAAATTSWETSSGEGESLMIPSSPSDSDSSSGNSTVANPPVSRKPSYDPPPVPTTRLADPPLPPVAPLFAPTSPFSAQQTPNTPLHTLSQLSPRGVSPDWSSSSSSSLAGNLTVRRAGSNASTSSGGSRTVRATRRSLNASKAKAASIRSTRTFGTRTSEAGSSDESEPLSDSSRGRREKVKRAYAAVQEEMTRRLMAERRRRSEGEVIKRS